MRQTVDDETVRALVHVLGGEADAPRTYAFSARDRIDETVNRIRTVRDARYRYYVLSELAMSDADFDDAEHQAEENRRKECEFDRRRTSGVPTQPAEGKGACPHATCTVRVIE